jgi:hypothetical protein
MKPSFKPHILSILVLGIFCILAAGSINDESKSIDSSTEDLFTEMSNKDVAFALHCVLDSGQEQQYIYANHPDWIANPIDIVAVFEEKGDTKNTYGIITIGFQRGQIAPSHVGMKIDTESAADTSYWFGVSLPLEYYDINDLSQQAHNAETSYKINRDTLKMFASHTSSAVSDDTLSYTCSKMDQSEVPSLITDARNAVVPLLKAKQRSKEQEKREEENRHQF